MAGAKIGASAVVLKEVPPYSTVVGNPGRVVRQAGVKIGIDLDQIHLPDPVKERISTGDGDRCHIWDWRGAPANTPAQGATDEVRGGGEG